MKSLFNRILGKPGEEPAAPEASTQPAASVIDEDKLRQALGEAAGDEARLTAEQELGRGLAAIRHPPSAQDGIAVWIEAVCHVGDKALALDWLSGIEGDESLAEMALHARFADVRLAAARRIAESETLERVAEASRDRDKGVYRLCMDVLRERHEAAERARRATELALALRDCLDTTPVPGARLTELEKELRSLGVDPDTEECAALLEQIRTRSREESRALRELQSRAAEAEGLRAETAQDHWPFLERLEDWRGRCAALRAAAVGRPGWLADHPAARRLEQALQDTEARLAALEGEASRARECVSFLDAQPADTPLSRAAVEVWTALTKPSGQAARAALEARWTALAAHAAPPPPPAPAPQAPKPEAKKPPKPRFDLDALAAVLEQVEQALEQGQLHEAESADKRVEELLHGATPPGSFGGRLRRARAQIARLRGWARWGTDQARDHLIAAAEELLQGEHVVDELAHAVPSLRAEWKRLDAHGPSTKSQWERFDTALEKAYQPVLARRAEETARHEAARAAKEALLAEWEEWLAGVAWEHADYKVVETRRAEILGKWRAPARAGFKDERHLNKRLDALLATLVGKLTEARGAEVQRRQQLIAAAEALKDAADVSRAVAEAKALQERWQKEAGAVRLERKDEQKLWQRFRAALDLVFARRDASRAAQSAQREQRVQGRKARLDAFEQALAAAAEPGEVDRLLAEFRSAWSTGEEPHGRPDELEARARGLMHGAKQRSEALRRDRYQARFAVMAQKAELAEELEAAAASGGPTEELAAQAKLAFDALPPLPNRYERLLAERLTRAPAATADKLAQGRAQRDSTLLDLEILLGLPSPEGLQNARRTRQLEKLQNRFGGGPVTAQDPETMVAQWYATPATPDPAQPPRMAAIVRKVLERGGREG